MMTRTCVPTWRRVGLLLVGLVCTGAALLREALEVPDARLPDDVTTAATVRFLAIGDQGGGNWRQYRVSASMNAVAERVGGIHFVSLLGDNFYGAGVHSVDDRQWLYKFETMYDGARLAALPFYAVLGNHDYQGDPEAEIRYAREQHGSNRWRMPGHFYSVDYGRAEGRPLLRIVYLDTNLTGAAMAKQLAFLDAAFATDPPLWRLVAGHHPLRNYGKHGETAALVRELLPRLQAASVDLYLAGHDHNLQAIRRPGEPFYVISGAGGRPPYPLSAADDALRYGVSANGFVFVQADARQLTIRYYDAAGEPDAGFVLSHCAAPQRPCVAESQPANGTPP